MTDTRGLELLTMLRELTGAEVKTQDVSIESTFTISMIVPGQQQSTIG